ncbi:diguanylate cyclase [Paracoccus luteus]|uniref:diguanylate cyclase n=1 Tax=Paracoccus luteus TaxID=2508543 RepID=UPI00106FCC49|nr:diguanylate cyclase [Paracoccus luteus]
MSGQILVVDRATTSRITLKVRLSAACYDTLTARSGAEALACLARTSPDLVVLGGEPADMTAVALCRMMVAAADSRMPVVMLAPAAQRVAALRAGASAVLDPQSDDLTLLARVRGLLRDSLSEPRDLAPAPGMAEAQAAFVAAPRPWTQPAQVMLIADQPATARSWRQALAPRLDAQLTLGEADRALADAALGNVPDIYLIAADIAQPGDGLRLLSELRSRPVSCNAGFAVMLRPGRADMTTVALDLGAGEVLSSLLGLPGAPVALADEAALSITALLGRKRLTDARRAAADTERALARIDALTGLPNRRFALPRLDALCRAVAPGGGVAVALMDIDRFKTVNDRHGHAAGDAVLAAVAERLRAELPAPGFVARMGGEEFLAVIPGADTDTAAELAQRMRRAVGQQAMPLPALTGGGSLRITLSAGVASTVGKAVSTDAAELLERADKALRRAKDGGRDRLIVAHYDAAA